MRKQSQVLSIDILGEIFTQKLDEDQINQKIVSIEYNVILMESHINSNNAEIILEKIIDIYYQIVEFYYCMHKDLIKVKHFLRILDNKYLNYNMKTYKKFLSYTKAQHLTRLIQYEDQRNAENSSHHERNLSWFEQKCYENPFLIGSFFGFATILGGYLFKKLLDNL